MLNIWFRIMHCYIPIPTTDSNTSTGMISVILNMPSAANCQGNVRELHIVWRVVALVSAIVDLLADIKLLLLTFYYSE